MATLIRKPTRVPALTTYREFADSFVRERFDGCEPASVLAARFREVAYRLRPGDVVALELGDASAGEKRAAGARLGEIARKCGVSLAALRRRPHQPDTVVLYCVLAVGQVSAHRTEEALCCLPHDAHEV